MLILYLIEDIATYDINLSRFLKILQDKKDVMFMS